MPVNYLLRFISRTQRETAMKKYRLTENSRLHDYPHDGEQRQVRLWQIEALYAFGNVETGQCGGWIEEEANLSHAGTCWLEPDALVWNGARVEDDAKILGESEICHRAKVGGNAQVEDSHISGECSVSGSARVLQQSQVIAVLGLTEDTEMRLQIYGSATVLASRIVHQAQIYGHAHVNNAFVEHRSAIFDNAIIEGNAENNVWICDCAQVSGNARIIAGSGDSQIPTIRYSSRVYGNAIIEGDCVLKHRVQVYGDAVLIGGPVLLDNNVQIYGQAKVMGNVLIENNVQIYDEAAVEGVGGEPIHLRGMKDINGVPANHPARPFYGIF
ncbi:UDP-N-acetylglucosamine diphosphorylase/glucosamine-1-phosphate N-acetyltransferase [Cedecea neteri]|uniref:UDP-N-acetylglucosamine diphosphorylase/glucosamine-1-phosphate N-acetyltransferase n=1 Tax=Cedecea neteri TaxID=158822 RepID=A0A2X3L018_9ENTR|nr:UDP-N-acetylglucosamine diphosphorylase/glucosamine-1-phosphate N-acetyltransferase [Cedecea neteri]